MKTRPKIKWTASASLVTAILSVFPLQSRAESKIIDSKTAGLMGISFARISEVFNLAGIKLTSEEVLITEVYNEEQVVDLQSLDGFVIRVPISSILAGDYSIPKNLSDGD